MLPKTSVLMGVLFIISGCASAMPATTPGYDFAVVRSVVEGDKPIRVTMRYTNETDIAHCILAEDFDGQQFSQLFRIEDRNGEFARYIGMLRDIERGAKWAFFIVPSGKSVEATFDLSSNYELASGQRYVLKYSMPITRCDALNNAQTAGMGAAAPFVTNPEFGWEDRLEIVRENAPDWDQYGFFAELRPFELMVP